MRGWTHSDNLGLWDGYQYIPEVKVSANGSNPKVTFAAEANIAYMIQRSRNNRMYKTLTTVKSGTAGNQEYTDLESNLGSTPVFYRVIAQ
jgi:hypothetical protein